MRAALLLLAGCGRLGFDPIAATSDATTPDADTSRPSSTYEGTVLFVEHFDDGMFTSRGWYDTPSWTTTMLEHAPGSVGSFQCVLLAGSNMCQGGQPGRIALPSTDPLYFSVWIKRSPGGGGPLSVAYWFSDADSMFTPPFATHQTVEFGTEDANANVTLSDSLNIDTGCVKETDGTIVGCGGNFDTYPFGEARAVSACNGVASDVTSWICQPDGTSSTGYENLAFRTASATPLSDGAWHFVEGFFAMSTIAGGIGQPDGILRYWVDGQVMFASDHILMRTGAQPQLAWNQLLLSPYLEVAGAAQELWLDELTIAVGVR